MSIETRISETGLKVGDKVYAFKTPTVARKNPLQADLFYEQDQSKLYDFGSVTGFIVYPARIYPVVKVDGSEQEWPYPPGVWRSVSEIA